MGLGYSRGLHQSYPSWAQSIPCSTLPTSRNVPSLPPSPQPCAGRRDPILPYPMAGAALKCCSYGPFTTLSWHKDGHTSSGTTLDCSLRVQTSPTFQHLCRCANNTGTASCSVGQLQRLLQAKGMLFHYLGAALQLHRSRKAGEDWDQRKFKLGGAERGSDGTCILST